MPFDPIAKHTQGPRRYPPRFSLVELVVGIAIITVIIIAFIIALTL